MSASETPEQEIERLNSPDPVQLPLPKLLLDKTVSTLALIVTSPLWLVLAVGEIAGGLISRDDAGPIFYHETRVSAGKPFRLKKFRILKMRAIRDEIERGVMPKQVENTPGNLTAIGKVLKKTGLDELPQFWQILKGDMSLVGPRPKPVPEYDEEIERGIWRRKVIRAGLTGPAQLLKGTERTPTDELLEDLRYIERFREDGSLRSLALDLGLLWRTIKLMLKMTGE